jgi:hypothetical protein
MNEVALIVWYLMITDQTVSEWQQVLKSEFDKELTLEEARESLTEYVRFISLLSDINHR